MTLYQPFRLAELKSELDRTGTVKIWPQLESSDSTLHHQHPPQALLRRLREKEHIILEGPAGSGKTVLCLYLSVGMPQENVVYLNAQQWLHQSPGPLRSFLTGAACLVDNAMKALEQETLILILDAVDEAPWRPGGGKIHDAIVRLREEIQGKAGLLLTSRVSDYVPQLPFASKLASLAGISPDEAEAFLATYLGSRTGVKEVVDLLRNVPFRDAIKYSPLVLRFMANELGSGPIKYLAARARQ